MCDHMLTTRSPSHVLCITPPNDLVEKLIVINCNRHTYYCENVVAKKNNVFLLKYFTNWKAKNVSVFGALSQNR